MICYFQLPHPFSYPSLLLNLQYFSYFSSLNKCNLFYKVHVSIMKANCFLAVQSKGDFTRQKRKKGGRETVC
jgi:hypothetical protein